MKSIFVIVKKEFARFFGDRRLAITTLLLPGLMIYLVYNFMGNAITNNFTVDDQYVSSVAVVNLPESMRVIFDAGGKISLIEIDAGEIDAYKARVTDKTMDLLVVFPENFDADVTAYEPSMSHAKAPNNDIFSNSTSTESQAAYAMMYSVLDTYESALANKFDINNDLEMYGEDGQSGYDLATERDVTGSVFSSLLPMLLMIFMFSGCLSVAPESIAGEKERGTIATLLITPMKRGELAIGKIIALAVIALLSGLSSTLGTLISLPKMMGPVDGVSASEYAVTDYVMLACVILSTVLLLITLIAIISAFAKTVKEAATTVSPLMIIVMLIGVSAMFGNTKSDLKFYLIPLYNSVQSMSGIFSFTSQPVNIAVTVAVNLVCACFGAFILTKMFNNEKIMFNKA